jgi:hypothetical protein
MRSRFRFVAALLVLVTLSFTVAEGVWASTCMPGMGMARGTAMAVGAGAGHAEGVDSSGSPNQHSDQLPHCPLAPAAGACIALATSLPAHAPESLAPSPEGAPAVVSSNDARPVLLVFAFFRPPRA